MILSTSVVATETSTHFLSNEGEQDGGFLSPLSARNNRSEWYTSQEPIALTIPSGGTNDYEFSGSSFEGAGRLTQRIDRLDSTWTVTVTD